MTIIDQFIERYRKEYDYYLEVAKLCAQQCETSLKASGIRAIVTYRAKRIESLKNKVEGRNKTKKFQTVDEIYNDIIDFAGVRIALYFPSDRDEVNKHIVDGFLVLNTPKQFPGEVKDKEPSSYKKRFSGYWATHYRVRLKDENLHDIFQTSQLML